MTTETASATTALARSDALAAVPWSIFETPLEGACEFGDGPDCAVGPSGLDWLMFADVFEHRWWTNRYVILRQDALDDDEIAARLTRLVVALDEHGDLSGRPAESMQLVGSLSRLTEEGLGETMAPLRDTAALSMGQPCAAYFGVAFLGPLTRAGLKVHHQGPEGVEFRSHVIWRGAEPVGLIMPVREPQVPHHVDRITPELDAAQRGLVRGGLPESDAWHFAAFALATGPQVGGRPS